MKAAGILGLVVGVVLLTSGCASKKGCCNKAQTAASGQHFGLPMKIEPGKTVTLANVLREKEQYDGKLVRVSGRVESVCAAKGCWMNITDDGVTDKVFIKFTCPIEGRLIPMEAVGKKAVVEGTVQLATISEAEARHYKEDAGLPKEEIEKIVGPQKIIRMQSAGATIEGLPAGGA